MNHVNAISGRLSLRPPQRSSLEILERVTELLPPQKGVDLADALAALQAEYPNVTNFERDFPSLCFALATGVGKTRLMGAFIAYLHLAHGLDNFFVLAPNLTIYNKLIADFTPNTSKYVFTGISEFAINPPEIITGDNYESGVGVRKAARSWLPGIRGGVFINIFNISKITSEVRGGKAPRIKRLSEYIGQSYFDYLADLDDLVLLMDESHRYRASAGMKAINELKPVLGLELTATPFVESNRGPVAFCNVIYDYALRKAMEDGFVKEPAVVTRKDFNPKGMQLEEIERFKLEDGVHLHETVKAELSTYAFEKGTFLVKPFLLVIARDTTHAGQLMTLIQSDSFFYGAYRDKVIQVDSSRTGAEEDAMVARLLAVESPEEPTEIVIHVNMLKEGWDVTNLYTIVPLRAANARTLIEQSIGRGLRLPYGKRTGVKSVDRLNIIAHDKFQEIIDEANKPDSAIKLERIILDPETNSKKPITVISQSHLANKLGVQTDHLPAGAQWAAPEEAAAFSTPGEQQIAQAAFRVIQKYENQPKILPNVEALKNAEVAAEISKEVVRQLGPAQLPLAGVQAAPDIEEVIRRTIDLVIEGTINIPRILVVPKGEVRSGFKPFKLALESLTYQAPSEELWIQLLRTSEQEVLGVGAGGIQEARLEDYIVSGLVDYDDIAYDEHADLLYDLAEQVVQHFKTRLQTEDEVAKVLRYFQKPICKHVHAQMQEHFWEEAVGYEVTVSKGFTQLKPSAYTATGQNSALDFRIPPADKSNMAKYLFKGFLRCLYPIQKFDSDPERRMAVILDRDAQKWFRPASGQFQLFYKAGVDQKDYQPDFVAESIDCIYMIEVKASNKMDDLEVLAKQAAGSKWCRQASDHAQTYSGKPWKYLLIPHDVIAENRTLSGLGVEYQANIDC